MSQLFKTNLEEYARQCTLQRRNYEECLQQAQQRCMIDASAHLTGATTQYAAGDAIGTMQIDACFEQVAQRCMIELLEMPADPLGLDDENSVLADMHGDFGEDQEWQDDRLQALHQPVVNPTAKSPSPVGFGAP